MKKVVALFILYIISATAGYSQETFKRELAIGASLGTNFSTISFIPKVDTKMLQGYSGGIVARWNTEKYLGLQAEVNYSQQGWDEKFENSNHTYTHRIDYIELPIMTHINFGSKKVRAFFNIGPKVSYVIGENITNSLYGAEVNRENAQHDKAVELKFGWGACGGPGVEFHTGAGIFTLEGRYYYSLGDIYNSKKEDPFPKSSGQVLSVKLAYMLPIY